MKKIAYVSQEKSLLPAGRIYLYILMFVPCRRKPLASLKQLVKGTGEQLEMVLPQFIFPNLHFRVRTWTASHSFIVSSLQWEMSLVLQFSVMPFTKCRNKSLFNQSHFCEALLGVKLLCQKTMYPAYMEILHFIYGCILSQIPGMKISI